MTPEPTDEPVKESDAESSGEAGTAYEDLSRADKLGFYTAAVLVTLAGLGAAFVIYVVASALVMWMLGE